MTNDNHTLERALAAAGEAFPEPPLPDLSEAAANAGLLDIAYATLDSPVGRILLAKTEHGLVRLAYLDGSEDEDIALSDLAARLSPRVLESAGRLDGPRRELDEYFSGRRRQFESRLDWRLTHGFGRRVLQATARIPYGLVSTYKGVATEAGSPQGFRAAGNALGSNPLPIIVPYHRVLHADGGLGGYTGGLERKRVLLAVEGRVAA
jgi:methylated-DNA-[protein]-cysteine S-methyltransferase